MDELDQLHIYEMITLHFHFALDRKDQLRAELRLATSRLRSPRERDDVAKSERPKTKKRKTDFEKV